MNIILINIIDEVSIFPRFMGAHQIAWYMRKFGYDVQVITVSIYFSVEDIKALISKFITSETQIIGLSGIVSQNFLTSQLWRNIQVNLEEITANNNKIKIIAGGACSHVFKWAKITIVDYYFEGHAENTFLHFCEWLFRGGERPLIELDASGKKIIKEFSYTGPKLFQIENCEYRWHNSDNIQPGEVLPLETTRGCIFKCKFCQYPLIGKKKKDYLKPIEYIRDELIDTYERFGTTSYYILDDTFNADIERLEEFAKMSSDLPFKLKYACYLRLDLINAHRHSEDLLLESGLFAPFFGIESFNEKAAKFIGKTFSGTKAKDYLLYLIKDKWNNKVFEMLSFITGLPYTTWEDTIDTFNWCLDNKIQSFTFPPLIMNQPDTSYFTSEFEREAEKYGFTLNKIDSSYRDSWVHETGITWKKATNWSNLITPKLIMHNRAGGWAALEMTQYGFTENDLRQKTMLKLRVDGILKINSFIQKYKHSLLNA